jgi:hypothetical protein
MHGAVSGVGDPRERHAFLRVCPLGTKGVLGSRNLLRWKGKRGREPFILTTAARLRKVVACLDAFVPQRVGMSTTCSIGPWAGLIK